MKKALIVSFSLLLSLALLSAAAGDTCLWSRAEPLHESYDGILYIRKQVESPRKMDIRAMRIDTETPGIRFYSTPRSEEWGEKIGDTGFHVETRRERTDNFIANARSRGIRVAAAVNASGWRPWPRSPWNVDASGLLVSLGELVSPGDGRASFIENKDFAVRMDRAGPDYDISNIRSAVTGFAFVLEDGEVIPGNATLHPRTGIGISEDKRYVYFMTIDGRQPEVSRGATTAEVGEWLHRFGSHKGINMDGGGSTTMAWWDPAAEASEILNSTSDAYPRHVASNIGVCVVEASLELEISGHGMVTISYPDTTAAGNGAYFEAHYSIDEKITLTAESFDDNNYVFTRWVIDGNTRENNELTVNARPDGRVTAIFTKKP